MTALAAAQGALQRLFHRMVDAAPVAWRHDPLFRGASIGAGVTLVLFLLRVLGPHDPTLDAPATTLRYVPGVGMQTIGQRNCPPEDCGGSWGYAELLAAIADPTHPEHADRRAWLGEDFDPDEFDVDAADADVANRFGRK